MAPFYWVKYMLSMIYATSLSGSIGLNSGLPWPHMKADMQWFMSKTKNKVILMGGSTWDTLPQKLPGRINVVLSKRELTGPDLVVKGDPFTVLDTIRSKYPGMDIVVIGGAQVYKDYYQLVEQVHVTLIQDYYQGDTYFDMRGLMTKTFRRDYHATVPGDNNQPDLLFETYSRILH